MGQIPLAPGRKALYLRFLAVAQALGLLTSYANIQHEALDEYSAVHTDGSGPA